MPKQLYPKPSSTRNRRGRPRRNPDLDKEWHVLYSNPDNETEVWKHYDSETAVRADSWYEVKVLGFNTSAVLYSHDEYLELIQDV